VEHVARTPEQLGQVLKACRKNRRMTQAKVGAKVGVRQAQISSIETHGADITVDTLYRLLSALGLELVLRDIHARGTPPTEW
jgi:HTH-type transcriptional regulator/antitoxin HipB